MKLIIKAKNPNITINDKYYTYSFFDILNNPCIKFCFSGITHNIIMNKYYLFENNSTINNQYIIKTVNDINNMNLFKQSEELKQYIIN